MRSFSTVAIFSALAALATAQKAVPENLQQLRSSIVAQGQCNNVLKGGYGSDTNGAADTVYCGDHKDDYGIVYLQGTGGALSNMDVDCDGADGKSGSQCSNDGSNQAETAFKDTIASFHAGIPDISAQNIPFVVLGNDDYDLQTAGVQPLSVVAVVCGDKLVYGVWGDTNGARSVGEASISLADMCYSGMSGNSGHDARDVLYIAFTGDNTVPGPDAPWATTDPATFEQAISALGDSLVARIGGGNNNTKRAIQDARVAHRARNMFA